MKNNYDTLPPLAHNSTHYAVVTTLARLHPTELECLLSRCTGSHAAAFFLRELLYSLSPSGKFPKRPHSIVHRNGTYWTPRTQKQWSVENGFTRTQLETVYKRCKDLIEIDHFMFGGQRQTHYRIKFERLCEVMERDEKFQAHRHSRPDEFMTR